MELVEDKCTIINVCCLEAIVDHYNIAEAKQHITEFKEAVNTFCKEVKLSVCCKESFKRISSSHHLICETVEFVLEWDICICKLEESDDEQSEEGMSYCKDNSTFLLALLHNVA